MGFARKVRAICEPACADPGKGGRPGDRSGGVFEDADRGLLRGLARRWAHSARHSRSRRRSSLGAHGAGTKVALASSQSRRSRRAQCAPSSPVRQRSGGRRRKPARNTGRRGTGPRAPPAVRAARRGGASAVNLSNAAFAIFSTTGDGGGPRCAAASISPSGTPSPRGLITGACSSASNSGWGRPNKPARARRGCSPRLCAGGGGGF